MKLTETSEAAIELLDVIEEIEMRSLSWGYPHGSLSYDEIEEIFNHSTVSGLDCDELVEELIEARLIFSFEDDTSSERFRSRISETIRLMVTNRQQFDWRDWQIAPQLVADYRVDRRKRIFPTRNVKFQDLSHSIALSLQHTSLIQKQKGYELVDPFYNENVFCHFHSIHPANILV